MKFLDWFDIYNTDHLRAFQVLARTGIWPKGFLPDDAEMRSPNWRVILAFKMANAWAKRYLETGGRRQDED